MNIRNISLWRIGEGEQRACPPFSDTLKILTVPAYIFFIKIINSLNLEPFLHSVADTENCTAPGGFATEYFERQNALPCPLEKI